MNSNTSAGANSGNSHLNVHEDEVPPPPYSETDVFSTSGGSRSPHTASASSVTASATAAAVTPSHSFIDDAASSTAGETIYTPPLTPRTSPGSGQPAASLYFDLRPVRQDSTPGSALIHTIEVNDASRPDDFPYQSEWTARDVTALDWSTFINFLIPDHTTRQNEAVIHRKLLDEMRSASGTSDDGTARVEAQLNQIADATNPANPGSLQRRRDVEATVQQWNDGFFAPRGIQLRLEPLRTPSVQMPGTWEANFDQAPEADRSAQSSQTAGRAVPAGGSSWSGFQIDDNGVRYGNSFVADQNGLRIGNLIMDQHGIRFGNGAAQSQQQQQPYADADRDARGRTAYPDEKAGHKRSDSVSSSSSASSSSSESSIGSLPSYDDVPLSSIQLYINRLQDWTKKPDQLRTKDDVKQLKAELKSIPKNRDVAVEVDKKALKAQIKTLTTAWKQIKKNQRRERKARRKERRDKRRAEHKERRQLKKEMKKARKDARKGVSPVPPPPPPGIPPPPHVPGNTVPPVPPVPPVNTSPWGTGSFPWGRPDHGRGGRGGRGGHYHHPHHPHQPHHPHGPPRGRGWGSWGNPQHHNDRGFMGGNGMYGPSGPFGPEGPFGAGGPFGPEGPLGGKGIFGGEGPFGPNGIFKSGQQQQQLQQQQQRQQQQQEQEQQRQQQQWEQQQQQREQQQQQREQQRQQREQQQQQREQQQQQREQQREQREQQRQQREQQRQHQQYQQQQANASSATSVPGSWPDEKKQQPAWPMQDEQYVPPPGPRASALYQAMYGIETAIQHQVAAAERAEGYQKEGLEKAIAEMKKKLESLRVEADEEYAKELGGN
ncbi:hypothetical protein V8C35DRAFT_305447 [Trichoderma chlorosporum]